MKVSESPSHPANPTNWSTADIVAGALCLLFIVIVYGSLSCGDTVLNHGDVHTDERAIVGAEEFRWEGTDALHDTQVEDASGTLGFVPSYYARHPSGGVVALSSLRRNGFSYGAARLLPLIASAIGLFGFFRFLFVLSRRRLFALAGMGLLATAAPYYILADSYQLYSYGLLAKGLCFWMIAEGTVRSWPHRLIPFATSGLIALVGVAYLGLESMPAIGLASFVTPLLLSGAGWRNRVLASLTSATLTGSGMALGCLILIRRMMTAMNGTLDETLDHLAQSVSSRSIGTQHGLNEAGRDYVGEISHRLDVYLEPQIWLAGIGLLVVLGAVFALRHRGARLALAAASACALAEIPYFFLMRDHVFIHQHTTVHVTATAAAFAALAFAVLPERGRIPLAISALVAALVVTSSALRSPDDTYGNLILPSSSRFIAAVSSEIDELLDDVPEGSILVVRASTPGCSWHLRARAAMHGIRSVDFPADSIGRWLVEVDEEGTKIDAIHLVDVSTAEILDVVDRPEVASRTILLVLEQIDEAGIAEATRSYARLKSSGHFALFGLERCYPGLMSDGLGLTRQELRGRRLLSPSAEAIQASGITYPLVNDAPNGVWLHASPAEIDGATTAELQLAGQETFRAISCAIDYEPAGRPGQPNLSFTLRAFDGETEIGHARRRLSPSPEEFRVVSEFARASTVDRLVFELTLTDGARYNSWARVVVRDIELLRRADDDGVLLGARDTERPKLIR